MSDDEEALTVDELIAKLRKFPGHFKVSTEGCDCCGPAAGVEDHGDDDVLITRTKDTE